MPGIAAGTRPRIPLTSGLHPTTPCHTDGPHRHETAYLRPRAQPQPPHPVHEVQGISLDTQQIDLGTAEQLTDAVSPDQPGCSVPALQLDDGTVLTEVIGICTYLESLHPEKPLLGSTPLEQALVISWDHRIFVTVFSAIAGMLRNRSRALPTAPCRGAGRTPDPRTGGARQIAAGLYPAAARRGAGHRPGWPATTSPSPISTCWLRSISWVG